MYSEPAVECVRAIDEVVSQSCYGALSVKLRRFSQKSSAGGTRTHHLRLLKHVLQLGSRSFFPFEFVFVKCPTKWRRDVVPCGTPNQGVDVVPTISWA
jgi:hypothetical protein